MHPAKFNANGYIRLTIDRISDDGCMNFFEAFLEEISREYLYCLSHYVSDPSSICAKEQYEKICKYIRSKFFTRLTGLDSEEVLKILDNRYMKERRGIKWQNFTA